MLRLFLDGQHTLVLVELHDAEALGVLDMIAENRGIASLGILDRLAQIAAKAVAVENIVAEDHGAGIAADEIGPDQKRLRQTVRMRLHRVGQPDAELAAVAEQTLEARRVLRRGDDENVADAREHERRERVVDHGLVVHRQQLLGRDPRERVQPCAGAPGEDDAFHRLCLPFQSLRYRSRVYTFSGTSSSADSARLATMTAAMRLNSVSDAITGRPSQEAALSVGS